MRGLADLATAELEAEARETDAPVELGDVKAVRLMSIHAAKGLEFHTVCVADLGRRRPGDEDDLLVDGDEVGLRLVGLDGSSERALAYERLRDRVRERSAREEDRVLYVARDPGARAADPQRRRPARAVAEGRARGRRRWRGSGAALLGDDLARLPTAAEPDPRHRLERRRAHRATVRCALNAPGTIGARPARELARARRREPADRARRRRRAPRRRAPPRAAARASARCPTRASPRGARAAIATTCSACCACPRSRSSGSPRPAPAARADARPARARHARARPARGSPGPGGAARVARPSPRRTASR